MLATKHACIRTGLVLSVALVGCSADRFAAESAGNIATTSSDAMRGFWDYDIARGYSLGDHAARGDADRGAPVRLSNNIARRHAELLLQTHPRDDSPANGDGALK